MENKKRWGWTLLVFAILTFSVPFIPTLTLIGIAIGLISYKKEG